MRWPATRPATTALAASCAVLLGACALTAGDPWGTLELDLAVEAAAPPERIDDQGRIRTANDYRIALDHFAGEVSGIVVRMRSSGDTLSFDPANPPPGYGLCHAGHCHADDGALVPYEEIEAELSGDTSGGSTIAISYSAPFELTTGDEVSLPSACPQSNDVPCDLERGSTDGFDVAMRNVRIAGRAFDSRTGSGARIPAEGIPFEYELPGPVSLRTTHRIALDRGEPVVHPLLLRATLEADTYDAVDWSLDSASIASALAEGLAESLTLTVVSFR